MDLERLTCSSCGAALQVPEGVDLVNCRHCGSSLKIRRTDSVVFTEMLQSVKEQADRLEQTTEQLQVQYEMDQLDRDWERESAQLMVRGKYGHTSRPSKFGAVLIGSMGTAFGIFWTGQVASHSGPKPLVAFGMIFVLLAIGSSISMFVKAIQYERQQEYYESRRRELLVRLATAGRSDDSH